MSSPDARLAKKVCLNPDVPISLATRTSALELDSRSRLCGFPNQKPAIKKLSVSLPHRTDTRPVARLALDSTNMESRQHKLNFDDAHQTLEGRSWDEFDSELVGIDELVWFDRGDLSLVLHASKNVVLGLNTDFFEWDYSRMQFMLRDELSNASFASYLKQLSRCGSLIRRLSQATSDIREAILSSNAQSVLALAAQVDREVYNQQSQGVKLQNVQELIQLVIVSQSLMDNITVLAELIGCQNLGSGGRLKRIPSIAELLQRTYERAIFGDSNMLWRLVGAAFTPWTRQLNYATGLMEISQPRAASFDLKHTKFPELFIDIDEDSNAIVLLEDHIPRFFPMTVAYAVLDCYKLLCYLVAGRSGVAPSAGQTDIKPVEWFEIQFNQNVRVDLAPSKNSKPINRSRLLESRGIIKEHQRIPGSVQLLEILSPILYRRAELNLNVKSFLKPELEQFCTIAISVFMLNNGELWSRLTDALPITNQSEFFVVSQLFENYGVRAVMSKGTIVCDYVPNKVVTTIFGSNIVARLQALFEKLVDLYLNNRQNELALQELEINTASRNIKACLYDEKSGIFELVAAFDSFI